ncbi:MAG: gamma-glutamyl-phosphate reductase, partial [Nocardioides kribbensis]
MSTGHEVDGVDGVGGADERTVEQVHEVARRARSASHPLALATRARKDAVLHAMADDLLAR